MCEKKKSEDLCDRASKRLDPLTIHASYRIEVVCHYGLITGAETTEPHYDPQMQLHGMQCAFLSEELSLKTQTSFCGYTA